MQIEKPKALDKHRKGFFSCRRQHGPKGRVPVQEVGKVVKRKLLLEWGAKAMEKGHGADMLVHMPWCMYLLGACFTKKPVPKENNGVFMFWMAKALMQFQSMRAASFLRKTSAVPSGYFCFCRERKNAKWGKEKMKCLWQENNVPEATPLNTERQQDRTFILHLFFCVFLPI